MLELRTCRELLRLSQTKLARLSNVSRFKICLFELGDGALSAAEQRRVSEALRAELDRLQNISIHLDIDWLKPLLAQQEER
jgi:hypothetical protein